MCVLGNYTSLKIEHIKREVIDFYKSNGLDTPKSFEDFILMTKFGYDRIDALKEAVVSISKERDYMSNAVNDLCFTIETEYQGYYNLNKDDWGMSA